MIATALCVVLAYLLGLRTRMKQRLYDAWSEGYSAAVWQQLAVVEALKAAKPEGNVSWFAAGWYRFEAFPVEGPEPTFRGIDALTVEDYLAHDLRHALPGEPCEKPSNGGGFLSDPEAD